MVGVGLGISVGGKGVKVGAAVGSIISVFVGVGAAELEQDASRTARWRMPIPHHILLIVLPDLRIMFIISTDLFSILS
jgi:hypothetical protein